MGGPAAPRHCSADCDGRVTLPARAGGWVCDPARRPLSCVHCMIHDEYRRCGSGRLHENRRCAAPWAMRGVMEDGVALLGQFIDGRHEAGSGGSVEVLNPADGSVVATLGEATVADVDSAVAAARRAYPGWSRATPGERSAALLALADRMEARADEYAARRDRPVRQADQADHASSTSRAPSTTSGSSPVPRGSSTAWRRRSTTGRTPPRSAASRSASSARSPRGTTRCRWPCGRSCPPSRRGTRSSSSPPRSPRSPR